jgi:hypothetical protein
VSRTFKSGAMGGLLGFHHQRPVQPWVRIRTSRRLFSKLVKRRTLRAKKDPSWLDYKPELRLVICTGKLVPKSHPLHQAVGI